MKIKVAIQNVIAAMVVSQVMPTKLVAQEAPLATVQPAERAADETQPPQADKAENVGSPNEIPKPEGHDGFASPRTPAAVPAPTESRLPPKKMKVFRLVHLNAAHEALALRLLFDGAQFLVDERGNRLTVNASDNEQLLHIEGLLLFRDRPTPPTQVAIPARPYPGSPVDDLLPPSGPTLVKSRVPSRELPGLAEANQLERRADGLAAEIRRLRDQADTKLPEIEVAQARLAETLSLALEHKLQGEQAQIQALEARLTRLKTQSAERRRLSRQIVERRMSELLQAPETAWQATPQAAATRTVLPPRIDIKVPDPHGTLQNQTQQTPVTVDLFAFDGIYQNQKLLHTIVQPLNQLPGVTTNIRIVPGEGDRIVMAYIHDPAQRFIREMTQNKGVSLLKQQIIAACKAGGVEAIRLEEGPASTSTESSGKGLPKEVPAALSQAASFPDPTEDRITAANRISMELIKSQLAFAAAAERLAETSRLREKNLATQSQYETARHEHQLAELQLGQSSRAYDAFAKDLDLQIQVAQIDLIHALANLDRAEKLSAKDVMPQQELRQAERNRQLAELAVQRLVAQRELLKQTPQAPGQPQSESRKTY